MSEPRTPGGCHVRVALPRAAGSLFTYRVPDGFGAVRPGTRVLVPLGRRRLTGTVVELLDGPDIDPSRVRDVERVVDPEPGLPPALLELARFIADYYVCPLGDVLRAMSPGGPRGRSSVRLTEAGRAALEAGVRGAARRAILGELARGAELSVAALRRRTGVSSVASAVRDLEKAGLVALGEGVAEDAGPLELREYEATGEPMDTGRSAVAREVLESLAAAARSLPAVDLVARTGRSDGAVRAALRRLVEGGAVRERIVRVARRPHSPPSDAMPAEHELTRAQREALSAVCEAVDAGAAGTFLVEGVTGSGKTEVYLRALARAVALGRTGIYLVPEISITPLLLRLVRSRFGARTAILHSALGPGERHDERERILAGEVDVVVGARSAVFAPLPRLGLLVVDEEHDASYKQDTEPRYHGRDVAVMRGAIEGVPVVLGSATPSLESYQNAVSGKYRLLRLPERVGGAEPAHVEIVDMREEWKATRQASPFSRRLREALDATLSAGRQAMILLNRRGWADFLLCRECGEPERCEQCSVTLTVHLRDGRLQCHYCGATRPIPASCRQCGGTFLQQVGQGTEQLESALGNLLPGVPIARLDRDVARRKGAVGSILADFEAGRVRVLLGTQMIAKGHDFPGVTLVGVLQADRSLWLPDFRAAERTFQLLVQVAGRAGRRRDPGLVVVQTFSPDHPAMALVERQDFAAFHAAEAPARQALAYPPFTHLILLLATSEAAEAAEDHVGRLAEALRAEGGEAVRVIGPAPAPIARIQGRFRFQLMAKSRDRRAANAAVRRAVERVPAPEGVRLEIDVDPQSLL